MTKRRAAALVLVVVAVPALFVAEQAIETLYTLERVEQQRHDDILHHDIAASDVERMIVGLGFETVMRDDHFIERDPGGAHWWLIVFRKP